MVELQEYPAIRGHRESSVFPEDAQSLLSSLGANLYQSTSLSAELAAFRILLKDVPAHAYRRVAFEVRDLANLWHRYYREPRPNSQIRNFEHNLKNEKDLPYLLLFDGNGYNRERALLKVIGRLKSPIEVIALADLANNWVEPVRTAALSAIDRSYPETASNDLALSFSFFAENRSFWKRWDNLASEHVMSFFHASDVIAVLAKRLEEGIERRGSTTLSFALQTENFDPHLERILKTSKDSAIRALALRTLLSGEAVWRTGHAWEWTNKSLGERKRVSVLNRRKLSIQPPVRSMLIAALEDKSAQVRRIAAQRVIDRGVELSLPMADIARKLMSDLNPSIRRRGEYLARKVELD